MSELDIERMHNHVNQLQDRINELEAELDVRLTEDQSNVLLEALQKTHDNVSKMLEKLKETLVEFSKL